MNKFRLETSEKEVMGQMQYFAVMYRMTPKGRFNEAIEFNYRFKTAAARQAYIDGFYSREEQKYARSEERKQAKQRIKQLKKVESIPHSEEEINGVRLVVSPEDNRVQLFFTGKPSEEKRTELKRNGFRWAPSVGAWMAYLNPYAVHKAKTLIS